MRVSGWALTGYMLCSFNLGVCTVVKWWHADVSGSAPKDLTQRELHEDIARAFVPEMTVTLKFVSQDQLDIEGHADKDSFVLGVTPSAQPCEIHLSAGAGIHAKPSVGDARWDDDDMNEVISHEIFHCLRGSWHPPWSTIFAKEKSD